MKKLTSKTTDTSSSSSAYGYGAIANTGGRTGKILSRYVKKNALFAMLFAVLGLWALQLVFAYLAELEDFSDTYTFIDALQYIAYRSPYFLEQFTPTGALLGAVIGLGLLANNSELIVMRAAGLSIYRIVGWVLQPAVIFVIISLAVNQFVLPISNIKANQIRDPDIDFLASVNGYWTIQPAPAVSSDSQDLKVAETGEQDKNSVAAQTQDGQGYNILYIDYADANGNIGEVKRWHLDSNNNLTAVSKASEGIYLSETQLKNPPQNQPQVASESTADTSAPSTDIIALYQWQLEAVTTLKLAERAAIVNTAAEGVPTKVERLDNSDNADNIGGLDDLDNLNSLDDLNNLDNIDSLDEDDTRLTGVDNPQSVDIIASNEPLVTSTRSTQDIISLPISPSSVYLLTRRAEDLSLTQLYEHKRFNTSQGTRSLEHEVAFWQKLLSPFAILSLVIVACSFVFGSLRTHSLGLRIVVALIFGLLFSYIQDLTSFVSLATGVSPLLMVLIPIIGSALLGLYLIKRQG